MTKRGYLVSEVGREGGILVVAHTAREAKKIVWNKCQWNFDGEWVDVFVRWVRDADVADLEYGLVDDEEIAFSHGLISYLYH